MATQHQHGSMDITQQQKTFHGFIRLASWTGMASILVLIFMALTNS
jgi:Ni,Fe-hydrogenase I cytochrome b subunit